MPETAETAESLEPVEECEALEPRRDRLMKRGGLMMGILGAVARTPI